MKRTAVLTWLVAVVIGVSSVASAQTSTAVTAKPLTESDIELLRKDVQSLKDELITKNMHFTNKEAAAFWPVYREYAKEQHKLGDIKYHVMVDYAQAMENMSDTKAAELTAKMFELDKSAVETRLKYWPKFQKVLAPKRAAKFYQIDRRLSLMIDLELASEAPIMD